MTLQILFFYDKVYNILICGHGGMADTLVLGTNEEIRAGSSPVARTKALQFELLPIGEIFGFVSFLRLFLKRRYSFMRNPKIVFGELFPKKP